MTLLERAGLRNRLRAALRAKALVYVHAAPGYGKTTLVDAALRGVPVAVARYDAAPWDAGAFVVPLVEAVRRTRPDFGRRTLALAETNAPMGRLGVTFAADLAHVPDELLIVVDDAHALGDDFGPFVDGALRTLPETVGWLVVSRAPAPFGIADLLLRDRAAVFTEDDLRFSAAEVADLARQFAPGNGAAALESLVQKTEGWPAGVALSLRTQTPSVALADGAFPAAGAFLVEQLVRGFSAGEVAALEAAAVHEVVDDETLDGEFVPEVRTALDDLARRGAMVSRTSAQALRVHPMLRDVVIERIRRRDGPAAIRALHARAASHYGSRGAIGATLFHLESAGNGELIRTLIRRIGSDAIVRGYGDRVRGLIARMQENGVDDAVLAAYIDGWIAKTRGRADRRERFAEALALADASGDVPLGFAARLETVEYDLSRGLPVERDTIDDLLARAGGLGPAEMAAAAIRAGWDAVLRAEPERSLALVDVFAGLEWPVVRHALVPLRAYALTLLGRFADAEREMTVLLESLHDADSLALRGRMLVWSARLALLRGETQAAWDDIREADRTGGPFLAGSETAAFAITLAQSALDHGDIDVAERATGQARAFAPSAWYERDRVRVPALAALYTARVAALRDGPAAALALADAALADGAATYAPALATDAVAHAARLHAPLRARIDVAVRAIRDAELADASDAAGRATAAAILTRIDPGVSARLPVLDAPPFGLLVSARAGVLAGPRFEQALFADERPAAAPATSPHERLTAREAEILELLAQGLTNKEIAQRFVLSPRTVETHVARILGKVGVNSRSRAIAAYVRKSTDGHVGLARL